MHSPDVLRQTSNVILKAIELKGIGCVWDEVEESRSECVEEEGWQGSRVWSEPPVVEKNSSKASTNDQYSTYYPQMYQQAYAMYEYDRRCYEQNFFMIDIEAIG